MRNTMWCRQTVTYGSLVLALCALACRDPAAPVGDLTIGVASRPSALQSVAAVSFMDTVMSPQRFQRRPGRPVSDSVRILVADLDAYAQPFTLHVINGGATAVRASSARVSLNGTEVFGPRAFTQAVDRLSADIVLTKESELVVTLESRPMSALTVWIEGRMKPGRARIGAAGGSVVSADGAVTITIPPGAFDGRVLVTALPVDTGVVITDDGIVPLGSPLEIEAGGAPIRVPIQMTVRPTDADHDGRIDGSNVPLRYGGFLFYSDSVRGWVEPPQHYDPATGVLTVTTTHLSVWWYVGFQPYAGLPRTLRWKVGNLPPLGGEALPALGIRAMDRQKIETDIQFAIRRWEAETRRAGLTFLRVGATDDADIEFRFAPNSWFKDILDRVPFVGGTTLAVTSYGTPRVIHFNDEWTWLQAEMPSGNTLAEVALHEIGHAIGLNHPCALSCTEPPIMAGTSDGIRSLALEADDIDQVRDRYGIAPPMAFSKLSAGGEHTCALSVDGAAYCWGAGGYGALGTGIANQGYFRTVPIAVAGGHRFVDISVNAWHACGVTTTGDAYCWGLNTEGQLGAGLPLSFAPTPAPAKVLGGVRFLSVSAGSVSSQTCGISVSRTAYCWGAAALLGDGTAEGSNGPVPVAGGLEFASLSAGNAATCGVTTTGVAYCWGMNAERQLLGTGGEPFVALEPALVAGGHEFLAVSVGDAFSACGIATDHRAYCWGTRNLGDGTTGGSAVPVAVAGDQLFETISVGGQHTCASSTSQRIYCWGDGQLGQLGSGLSGALVPRAVEGTPSFVAASAGTQHSCGLTVQGEIFCWGSNRVGQLGIALDFGAPLLVSQPQRTWRP